MNKIDFRKAAVYFWLLMLTIVLTGCGRKQPGSDKEGAQPTSAVDKTNNADGGKDVGSNTDNITISNDKEWPADSVTFSTTHGYTAFLKLHLELPEGIAASDLTKLSFALDAKEPLELRLYAGADEILKNSSYELTGETVEAEAISNGTEQVEVDGKKVEQENYTLNLSKKDVTRFYLSEGEGQNLVFNADERATGVLSAIDGEVLVIGIYANNMAPEFTIYNVSYTAKGTEYPIVLDENSVKPTRGSYLQFH